MAYRPEAWVRVNSPAPKRWGHHGKGIHSAEDGRFTRLIIVPRGAGTLTQAIQEVVSQETSDYQLDD